jgi:hypothetical protein
LSFPGDLLLEARKSWEKQATGRNRLLGATSYWEKQAPRRVRLPGENYWEKQAPGRFSPGTSDILGVRPSWEIFSWDFKFPRTSDFLGEDFIYRLSQPP